MNIKSHRSFLAFLLPIVLYASQKLIFNDEGDVQGGITLNSKLYTNAGVTILIVFLANCAREKPFSFKKDRLSVIFLLYYVLGCISSMFSFMPMVTLYWSIVGLGYYGVSLLIAESILEKTNNQKEIAERFTAHIILYSVSTIIVFSIFKYLYADSLSNFDFSGGIYSDHAALLFLLTAYVNMEIIRKNTRINRILVMFAVLIGGTLLNSLSAYLAFLLSYTVYKIRKGRWISFIFMGGILLCLALIGYSYIQDHTGEKLLFSKNAEAFLTGSGRFVLYSSAVDAYINDLNIFEKFFGVGFAAERIVLMDKDLPWITDPHNSFILSTLGMGVIGAILYFSFALHGMRLAKRSPLGDMWFIFHVAFLAFGVTQSSYLGKPSFLLIYGFALFQLQFRYDRMKQGR